jgi:nicotinamidase-related amidase
MATRRPRAGFGQRIGPGARPAVVVVDMNLGFTDPASPLACDLDATLEAIARLLAAARERNVPVVYTTVAYAAGDRAAAAVFLEKIPALATLEAGSRWTRIHDRVAPAPGEAVLTKLFASAFFGTPLASLLMARGVDTLLVTGASTSGCVRATVLDALQHGLRPLVPEEAVGDRDAAAHEANLFDMGAKYADVVGLEEALAYLASMPKPSDPGLTSPSGSSSSLMPRTTSSVVGSSIPPNS